MRRDTPALACTPAEARAMVDAAKTGASVTVCRAIEPQPVETTLKRDVPQGQGGEAFRKGWRWNGEWLAEMGEEKFYAACPWKVGDVLDVLEPWIRIDPTFRLPPVATRFICQGKAVYVAYEADGYHADWQPAESMPVWAVRLTLRVGAVSVVQQQGEWRWSLTGTVTPKGASRAE